MSTTATTKGALAHARAQAGTVAEHGPTIPSTAAVDLPDGVDASTVVWDERVAPGGYASRVVARGTTVRIVDVDGDACCGVLLLNAEMPTERLNVADTVKVQWQAYLGEGAVLLSDMGRSLATIVADTSGRHDALCGTSSAPTIAARHGDPGVHGAHPDGRDRFAVALGKHGLGRRDIHPNVNLFKGVRVGEDGSLSLDGAPAEPGAHVELRAEMHLIVVLISVPHVLDPRPEYSAGTLRVTAWPGAPTAADDPQWNSSPERARAYANVADWYAARPVARGVSS